MSIWTSMDGETLGLSDAPYAIRSAADVALDVAVALSHNNMIRLSNFTSLGADHGGDVFVDSTTARLYAAKLLDAADRVQRRRP